MERTKLPKLEKRQSIMPLVANPIPDRRRSIVPRVVNIENWKLEGVEAAIGLAREMGIAIERDVILSKESGKSKHNVYPVIAIRTKRNLTPFWDALRNEVPDYWDRSETD